MAIVSEAMSFHHSSFSEWWQRIACLCNIRANLTLDGKVYAKYGATPDIQILVIDKTGKTPGDNWKEQLENIVWSDAATIEELEELLIRADLGLSFTQAGTLAAATNLTYALMQVPSGWLADRFTPRRLFLIGLLSPSSCGMILVWPITGMKLASPTQRGTRCTWR